jgi:hypothetical protein
MINVLRTLEICRFGINFRGHPVANLKPLPVKNMRPFYNSWIQSKAETFWGEIAPREHVIQFYETDHIFLDALAGFVGSGINAGDSCVVILTEAHMEGLNKRLRDHSIHIQTLIDDGRYIPLDAAQTLSSFMVNGCIDKNLFYQNAEELMKRARKNNRRVRACGEMVALLWQQGNKEATVELEQLWEQYRIKESISIFCAYPKTIFKTIDTTLVHVCGAHSKMITGAASQLNDVYYQELSHNKSYLAH